MATEKTLMKTTVVVGGVAIEFEASIDVASADREIAERHIRQVMVAAVELGLALLDVGAVKSEHRV